VSEFYLIVAGGRDFEDYELLKEKLDFFTKDKDKVVVVSGAAKGADTLGEQWAKERGYEVHPFPALWNKYGKRAGFIRNAEMLNYADALVAFWDGKSRGTAHMIKITREKGLPLRVVRY
jgi:hypothetical protein